MDNPMVDVKDVLVYRPDNEMVVPLNRRVQEDLNILDPSLN